MVGRKLLIFGNGLGMALDPDFFTLSSGIERVWIGGCLSESQKALINSCAGCSPRERPRGEEDLDSLQRALVACEFLDEVSPSDVAFLTQEGQDFPKAIRVFVREVAYSFHTDSPTLPSRFVAPLVQFLDESHSHVATLNYDRLLYDPFIQDGILADYQRTVLVDGFLDTTGFRAENLERRYGNRFGYYLHLHGSPLFVQQDGKLTKLKKRNAAQEEGWSSRHVVLTDIKHKRSVIDSSEILRTYWEYLGIALREAHEIIVFGYSGRDEHLNEYLRERADGRPIRVVEWKDAGTQKTRELFWRERLAQPMSPDSGSSYPSSVEVERLENILDFEHWD